MFRENIKLFKTAGIKQKLRGMSTSFFHSSRSTARLKSRLNRKRGENLAADVTALTFQHHSGEIAQEGGEKDSEKGSEFPTSVPS